MPRVKTDDGITLYYETLGEGPVLIFHGHHHRRDLFAQAAFFSRYFQVISYDRRGCGRSDDPVGEWSPQDFSRDCLGLLDALNIDKAIVTGSSTGGMLSVQFGLDYPDRTAAIVAANLPCWPWEGLQEHHLDEPLKALDEVADDNDLDVLELMARVPVPSWDWESEPPILIGPEFESSDFMPLLAESGAWDLGTSRDALRKLIEITGKWDLRTSSDKTKLKELQAPTLIIMCQAEPPVMLSHAFEMFKMIPNAEFVMLPGYHADARFVRPIKYNTEIKNFLDRRGLLPPSAEPPGVGAKEKVAGVKGTAKTER